MQFFKQEQFAAYTTFMDLAEYKKYVDAHTNFYIKNHNDGIRVEWKLSRGIFLIAIYNFNSLAGENIIEITARLKHFTLYKTIFSLWVILGSLWILFLPSLSSITSVLFGTLVFLLLWSFAVSNRNNFIEALAPKMSEGN